MNRKVYIIGHRGAAGLAVENTLPAIQIALEMGVDLIEIDIRQTLDGAIVLMHDRRLQRTTAARGLINKKTLAQLPDIPRLADVFELMVRSAGKTRLMIEIKDPRHYPRMVSGLTQLVREYNMQDRVIICSFNKKVLSQIHKTLPALSIGLLTLGLHGWEKGNFAKYLCAFWLTVLLCPRRLRRLQNNGYTIFAWTVDNEAIIQYLVNSGVDGIITNRPDRLMKFISRLSPHSP